MIVSLTLTLASWFSMRISFELLSDCHFDSLERKRNKCKMHYKLCQVRLLVKVHGDM